MVEARLIQAPRVLLAAFMTDYREFASRNAAVYLAGASQVSNLISRPSPSVVFREYVNSGPHEIVGVTHTLAVCNHVGFLDLRHFGRKGTERWESGVAILAPGAERRLEAAGASKVQTMSVAPDLVEAVLEQPLEQARIRHRPAPVVQFGNIQRIVGALHADVAAGAPSGPLFADSLAVALVVAASERTHAGAVTLPFEPTKAARLQDFIEAHLSEDLGLARLAEAAQLSVRQLTFAFRDSFGQPLYRYVLWRRVLRAATLIRLGLPLGEIAVMTGFDSRTSLARAFRQIAGITPSDVRRGVRVPGAPL